MTALSIIGLQPEQAVIESFQMSFDGQDLTTLNSKDWQKIRGNTIGLVFQEPQSSFSEIQKVYSLKN